MTEVGTTLDFIKVVTKKKKEIKSFCYCQDKFAKQSYESSVRQAIDKGFLA